MSENILQRPQESQERFLLESLSPYFLQTILRLIYDGVLLIHLDGTVRLINDSAKKILRLPLSFGKIQKYWELLPDDAFGFSMKEALQLGISHKLLYRRYLDKDLEISATYLCEGDKYFHGELVIFRDITEKQTLLSELRRDERMRQLGEMVAITAHEIKNPLGGIRGYASLLYRDLEHQKNLQEMAGFVINGAKALERLVTGVLHFAKPTTIFVQSIEIGQFLRQVVKFVKADPACPQNVQWHIHIPAGSLMVPIDPLAMKSALLNLIFNAFHAMPHGGNLTLSVLKTDTCYQMAISDTGIGMDEPQQKKLFSPFFTTKDQGNGFGLVEVQKIVKAHEGSIEVRSFPNKGTTFTLLFPLRRASL